MEFDETIKKRASIKKYSNKKVDYDKIIDCLEAARLAPSPGNISAIRFILVEDKEKIKELSTAAQQSFIREAGSLIIVCSDLKECEKLYYERAQKYIYQYAGAVIENLLLKITGLKLAGCWIGAFSDETVKRILNIPDDIEVEAIIPIAYQSKTSSEKQKSKPSLSNTLFFEEWDNKTQKKPKKIMD